MGNYPWWGSTERQRSEWETELERKHREARELSPYPTNSQEPTEWMPVPTQEIELPRGGAMWHQQQPGFRVSRDIRAVGFTHPGRKALVLYPLSHPQEHPLFLSTPSSHQTPPAWYLIPRESLLCWMMIDYQIFKIPDIISAPISVLFIPSDIFAFKQGHCG